METALLILWLVLWFVTPLEPNTIEFRGQVFLANRADSLAEIVRADIATIEAGLDTMERVMRSLDETFRYDPGAIWYQNKQRKAAEFRERADSLLRELGRELEGLE